MGKSPGCKSCMYWSELVAMATVEHGVMALCLNEKSDYYQEYAHIGCDEKEIGEPIDMPGGDSR